MVAQQSGVLSANKCKRPVSYTIWPFLTFFTEICPFWHIICCKLNGCYATTNNENQNILIQQ